MKLLLCFVLELLCSQESAYRQAGKCHWDNKMIRIPCSMVAGHKNSLISYAGFFTFKTMSQHSRSCSHGRKFTSCFQRSLFWFLKFLPMRNKQTTCPWAWHWAFSFITGGTSKQTTLQQHGVTVTASRPHWLKTSCLFLILLINYVTTTE